MTREVFTILLGLTSVAFTSQALAQDVTPPTVTSAVAAPPTIDVSASSQSVTLTVAATDDLSGIRVPGPDTRVIWRSPSNQVVQCSFVLVSGTPLEAVLEATCVFPQFAEAGNWGVDTIIEDNAGNVARNSFSGLLTVAAADFSLDKTVNNATPDYQTNVVFTLTLINLGPTLGGATVTDLLPSGLTFVSADPAADYNDATGIWTTDVVAVDDTLVLTITARVETLEPVTNEAEITGASFPDPEPGNNSTSATITPVASDLALRKSLADFSGDADTNTITATFKLTVTNNGPSDASGVTVDDPLPEGATLVSASGTYDPDTGIWTIGALTSGASAILTTVLTADASHNLINIAVVSGDQPDHDLSNNLSGMQAQHDLPDLRRFTADLVLEKTVDNETPSVGQEITYTVSVTNDGPSTTNGGVIAEVLPEGVEFVRARVTSTAGQCIPCGYDPAQGRWTVKHLVLGKTAVIEITVRVVADGEIVNRVEVWKSNLPDPDSVIGGRGPGDEVEDDEAEVMIVASPRNQARAAEEGGAPKEMALGSNYPNPFNPRTVIPYAVAEWSVVRIAVYDVLGREVVVLVAEAVSAGRYEVAWDASHLPTGVYVVRMEAGPVVKTQRVMLMK